MPSTEGLAGGGAKYVLSPYTGRGDALTESAEVRLTSSPYRPRPLAVMLLVAFVLGIAAGIWETFPSVLGPGPLFVPPSWE